MTTAIAAERVRTAVEPDGTGAEPAILSAKESARVDAEPAIPSVKEPARVDAEPAVQSAKESARTAAESAILSAKESVRASAEPAISSVKESARVEAEPACPEFDRWGWPDDGKRYELVDGTPVELPPMRVSHSAVIYTIGRLVGGHIDRAGLPYLVGMGASFRLGMSGGNFRIPDLHITPLARLDIDLNDEPGVWEGYPDIAVEVVSPTDSYLDVVAKARLYLRQGVRAALLIDATHREVTVRQSDGAVRVLTGDDTLELGAALPGFSCRVVDIFTDLDRMAARTTETEGRTAEAEGEVADVFTDLDRMAAPTAEAEGQTTEAEGEVADVFTDLDRMAGRTAEMAAPTADTEGE